MSIGTLEVTLVSAAISPHSVFDTDPTDTYAILRCIQEQHCTKTAKDQGRLPVWNETFTFNLEEQDLSKDFMVQVFGARAEVDELLGSARIPILTMVGKEEATLCALTSPSKGETGKVKAAWKWKPDSKRSLKATKFEGKASGVQEYTGSESYTSASFDPNVPYVGDRGPVAYPHVHPKSRGPEAYSKLDDVSNALAKLTMDKGSSGSWDAKAQVGEYCAYSSSAMSGAYPTEHAPLSEPLVYSGYSDIRASNERKEEFSAYSSPVYSSGHTEYSYPPPPSDAVPVFPPNKETLPPYSGNQSSISFSQGSIYPTYPNYYSSSPLDKQGEALSYTERGGGDDKGHGSHTPYSQPPPAGYPPSSFPPNKETYPHSGYQSSQPPPAGGYPPSSFPPNKETYPPYSGNQSRQPPPASYPPSSFPPNKETYPPYSGHQSSQAPPAGYPPSSFPPNKETYPPYSGYQSSTSEFSHVQGSTYPPHPDYHSSSSLNKHGEALSCIERGAGGDKMEKDRGHGDNKEKGKGHGDKKEKVKGHGSHTPHGQPPPAGYPPSSYPPPPGYPPAPHGYPPAPQGYPLTPYSYPPAVDYHSVPSHPPYGYPPAAHGSHQAPYPVDHGHGAGYAAAGAYVGHSSSSSKPSKKHKEPKDSSSHQHGHHNKHKKQKSFKGLKFKKFKKFKF